MKKSLVAVLLGAVCLTCIPRLATAGGTIIGVVRYDGEAPPALKRPVTVDQDACGSEAVTETLSLGKRGVVQGVVVSLAGSFEGNLARTRPEAGYFFDEKGCRLNPRILVVPAGSDIKILNSDQLNHFYSIESRTNPPVSVSLPKSATSAVLHLDFPEIVELKCQIHDWERATVVVSRHPYVAVTDEQGRFEIKDVPVGSYTISFWQRILGNQSRIVQVREGEVTRADIILGNRKQSSFLPQGSVSLSASRLDVNILPIITVR